MGANVIYVQFAIANLARNNHLLIHGESAAICDVL